MNASADRMIPSASRVQAALLDYFKAPGKFQLTRRQPEVLFASIREVLQLAAGRAPAGGQGQDVQAAAAFFIRAALLYPGADHYTLLGLRSGTEPVELKERYRLLMRLIHPDFAHGALASWPADAAVRVNRAYEVLSSPVLRREYDDQLATSRPPQHAAPSQQEERRTPPAARRARPPRLRIAKKAAWTFVGLIALLGAGMLLAPSDRVTLVQKSPRAAAGPKPVPQPRAEQPRPVSTAPAELPARDAAATGTAPATPAVRQEHPTMARSAVAVFAPAPEPASRPQAGLRPPPPPGVPQRPVVQEVEHRPAGNAIPAPDGLPARAREALSPGLAQAALERPLSPPAAPLPAGVAVASIRPAAIRSYPSPTLLDAQPLLTQLLHLLESGNGDQLLRLLDDDARQNAAAQALRRQYQKIVARGGQVRLSHVDFTGEAKDDVLVVTGHMRMHVGETTIGSPGEALLLRAEFVSRGGRVIITGLSGGPH